MSFSFEVESSLRHTAVESIKGYALKSFWERYANRYNKILKKEYFLKVRTSYSWFELLSKWEYEAWYWIEYLFSIYKKGLIKNKRIISIETEDELIKYMKDNDLEKQTIEHKRIDEYLVNIEHLVDKLSKKVLSNVMLETDNKKLPDETNNLAWATEKLCNTRNRLEDLHDIIWMINEQI